MDKFVCVRLVKANAIDLSLFQFDYDLTFAALLINGDRTIYARYGSRTGAKAEVDMSLQGFSATLRAVLALHEQYPQNKELLAGKQPLASDYKTPDDYPSLKGKYATSLDYEGQVVRSCMHCHQIRDAQRLVYRSANQPLPDRLVFPYPAPQSVGLTLDPQTAATVAEVAAGSIAARAGFRAGDVIHELAGQPIVSLADVQWVLHQTADAEPSRLSAVVVRGSERLELELQLAERWRRASDISWRVTTWPLRAMAAGGMVLEEASAEQRQAAALDEKSLALHVKYVGQYGAHGVAKQVGFQVGDLLVGFDGRSDAMTESQLLAYAMQNIAPGESIRVSVWREEKRIEMNLPMQTLEE